MSSVTSSLNRDATVRQGGKRCRARSRPRDIFLSPLGNQLTRWEPLPPGAHALRSARCRKMALPVILCQPRRRPASHRRQNSQQQRQPPTRAIPFPFRSVCRPADRWTRCPESAARAHVRTAAVHFHFQGVAASRRRFRGRIAQQIILALFTRDFFEAGHQVIGVQDREATSSRRQHVHHLLIGGRTGRKLRNNLPRLVVRSVAVRTADRRPTAASPASGAALTSACSAATAASPATCSTLTAASPATGSAARPTTSAASGAATTAVSAACTTTGTAAVLWLGN